MFHLRGIAWKLCKAAKVHVMTSIFIIALSISLIVTMASYVTNAKEQLDANIDAMFGEMDLMAGYNYGETFYTELLNEVVALPEVGMVSPLALKLTEIEEISSVYTLGVENDDLVKSRYHFTADLTADTVVLSELLAKMLVVQVGETVTLDAKMYEVTEVLPTPQGAEPMNMALVKRNELVEAGSEGTFMLIQSEVPDIVATTIKELAEGIRIDIVDDYDFVKTNLLTLGILIVLLSVFVLLISAMLLMSTMQLVMTKIKEQLMILRSLGASSQQIAKIVEQQLLLIVGLGVVSGFILSLGFVRVGLQKITVLMKLPEATVSYPFLIALTIIAVIGCSLLLYMGWQVRKALQILPMQLKEEAIEKPFVLTKWKAIFSGVLTVTGGFLLLVGQTDGSGVAALQIVFGSIILSLVVLFMMPYIFQWLLNSTLKPVRRVFGKEAYLALQQLIPQIKMNMKVVLSLVGLMVILVFGSAALKTLHTNNIDYINERYKSDLLLYNATTDEKFKYSFVEELKQIEGVNVMSVEGGSGSFFIGDDLDWYDPVAMDFDELGIASNPQQIIVTEKLATTEQVQVGDWITPTFYDWQNEKEVLLDPMEIVKVVPNHFYHGAYFDWESEVAQKYMMLRNVHIEQLEDATVLAQLEDLLSYYPNVQLLEKSVELEQLDEMMYQRWGLFIGVYVLLLVATVVGIIQTLLHMIYTSRSQYTIQRLLGLTPNGLIKLLCLQVLTFVLYGVSVGLIVGVILTRLMAVIDSGSLVVFDYTTVGILSGSLIICMLVVFGLQGYLLSRRKLVMEMTYL